jgi:hypothetical protein
MVALPAAYRTAMVAGATYYIVDGVYYRAVKEEGQVVYVEVDAGDVGAGDAGAGEAEAQEAGAES